MQQQCIYIKEKGGMNMKGQGDAVLQKSAPIIQRKRTIKEKTKKYFIDTCQAMVEDLISYLNNMAIIDDCIIKFC